MFDSGLNVIEKHKNIRRLFAKALKGCEKEKPCSIPIYDFEEKECEYADVKRALGEDKEEIELRQLDRQPKGPTQQQCSLSNLTKSGALELEEFSLSAVRIRKQKWKSEELDRHLKALVDGNQNDARKGVSLEEAKHQLLSVVHFDGMVQLEDSSQTTAGTQQQQQTTKVTINDKICETSTSGYLIIKFLSTKM